MRVSMVPTKPLTDKCRPTNCWASSRRRASCTTSGASATLFASMEVRSSSVSSSCTSWLMRCCSTSTFSNRVSSSSCAPPSSCAGSACSNPAKDRPPKVPLNTCISRCCIRCNSSTLPPAAEKAVFSHALSPFEDVGTAASVSSTNSMLLNCFSSANCPQIKMPNDIISASLSAPTFASKSVRNTWRMLSSSKSMSSVVKRRRRRCAGIEGNELTKTRSSAIGCMPFSTSGGIMLLIVCSMTWNEYWSSCTSPLSPRKVKTAMTCDKTLFGWLRASSTRQLSASWRVCGLIAERIHMTSACISTPCSLSFLLALPLAAVVSRDACRSARIAPSRLCVSDSSPSSAPSVAGRLSLTLAKTLNRRGISFSTCAGSSCACKVSRTTNASATAGSTALASLLGRSALFLPRFPAFCSTALAASSWLHSEAKSISKWSTDSGSLRSRSLAAFDKLACDLPAILHKSANTCWHALSSSD
mmetsp:Transcript_72098/g.105660  ORF Transcript_72098/g.105660 Transcript_72098/m.105660 type:complete len:473 (-) Transcript_72098:2201-3619(-)